MTFLKDVTDVQKMIDVQKNLKVNVLVLVSILMVLCLMLSFEVSAVETCATHAHVHAHTETAYVPTVDSIDSTLNNVRANEWSKSTLLKQKDDAVTEADEDVVEEDDHQPNERQLDGSLDEQISNDPKSNDHENEKKRESSISDDLFKKSKVLTFYYTDPRLAGLIETQFEIKYNDLDEKLNAIWDKLQHPNTAEANALWSHFRLNKMTLNEHQLTIDVTMNDGVHFGSSAEGYAIQSLIQTFGQVEGVDKIQLLIDGSIEETLAGHISIDQPFSVEDSSYVDK